MNSFQKFERKVLVHFCKKHELQTLPKTEVLIEKHTLRVETTEDNENY